MTKSLEEPTLACEARRDEDDLGAVRGILVGSLCGGVAWGLLALSFWSVVFHA
jgi:hypothetical protein